MRLQITQKADPGGRVSQDDATLADTTLHLFAIADGMGAYVSGRPGADLALASLHQHYLSTTPLPPEPQALTGAALAAHAAIWAKVDAANQNWELVKQGKAESDPQLACWMGMASTLVALRLEPGKAHIAHVGDSRAYRLRNGQLKLLTVDHRLREDARKMGMPESEVEQLPANIIVRALGMREVIEVDVQSVDVEAGDVWMLCSDGLSDALSHEELEGMLRERAVNLDEALSRMVRLAVERGDKTLHDNVSILLVRVLA